ncbi:MAG: DNA repair ATPase [Verrucomicrobiaceae bacterium]|nr:DNA repair ATPase [Verrucomicrobiaceae bacterium]
MPDTPTTPPPSQLEAGAYEVIRARLDKHASELRRRLELLNADRKELFGGIETALAATVRLTTENNCVPRDLAAIGPKRFVFGYNVHLGLRSQMQVADVFAVYDYHAEDHSFHPNKNGLLADPKFTEDFDYLYRYYKSATFLKFHRIGPHLYMGMSVGRDVAEVKAFKWLVNDETGTLQYLGNRFDHEFVFPAAQEFEWKRARREMYRHGEHPHVSIEDRVFVETIGGDLTIKVENNTDSGKGIYSEPVENKDQTLDDAEIHYAIIGNLILLKVLPYQEKAYRYLVFNERTQDVRRMDAIAESCVLLPDDHGVIFPRGYVLQTGEVKTFETGLENMRFERRIASANGEDTLFIFHNLSTGAYLLFAYNLIEQSVGTPLICNGFSLFPTGELTLFQGDPEPRKHHVIQVWRTPFLSDAVSQAQQKDTFLAKIGNADIVRCMAECRGVLTLLAKEDTFSGLYVELSRRAGDIADSYFWIDKGEAHDLKSALVEIKGAAEAALGEFEKVRRMRKAAKDQTEGLRTKTSKALNEASGSDANDILGFVKHLTTLRELRGQILAARDVRYVVLDDLAAMEKSVVEGTDRLSQHCITFLLKPEALDPYRKQVAEQKARIDQVKKVAEANEVEQALTQSGTELEMLISVVSGLKIGDATETTRIIESISELYAQLNQVRSVLRNKRNDLAKAEGSAEFQAQLSLLNQSVQNYLEVASTPEKCDEALTRVMVQVEEVEGRFSEFDDFTVQLSTKREEIYSAFQTRRQSLVETRNKRCQSLGQSAERILASLRNRVVSFAKPEEVHAHLASDVMAAKLRDLIEELRGLGDSVRADELGTRFKTLHEDALKQIRDKAELFSEGGDLIQLGRHKFTVNRQPLELTILPHDGGLFYHLTGTRFFEKLEHPDLDALRTVWEQSVVSEDATVYRGEFLAWRFLQSLQHDDAALAAFETSSPETKTERLREFMHQRYSEGYTKGVHDHDAALIAGALVQMHRALGLLKHSPAARAEALVAWHCWADSAEKTAFQAAMMARGRMGLQVGAVREQPVPALENPAGVQALLDELRALSAKHPQLPFTRSFEAVELLRSFKKTLTAKRMTADFDAAMEALKSQPRTQYQIIFEWLRATHPEAGEGIAREAAALILMNDQPPATLPTPPPSKATITGLTGAYARIADGALALDYHEFTARLSHYDATVVPAFEAFTKLKHDLGEQKRKALRLHEFKASVLSSFVRNRLLDQVYLPVIGANLAKQLGAAGDQTRTDRMGLLMLISPPGYGKTTLMEYVANRLGITFVKINGPAIGHRVTSLDPAEAPNASAREEVEKLNLAFEMGDNVIIYVDDIQHTNPEFLQKFISLCDGSRKIEGVFKGVARTYDLRGRKVAVVMAGNPYTEVGGKFQVPDMLANRADTYNLGDILGGHEAAFKDSYIENALTSNATLAKIAARSHKDALTVLQIAQTGSREGVEFEGNFGADEINEAVAVMERLLRIREVILRVNQEYIRSAAQEDAYRTEPPFKLQGSYRNMNRIAEKVLPLMTEAEVQSLIEDHYRGESQTLSQAAEANLLKWREINNLLDEAGAKRWEEIKRTFGRNLLTGGGGDNDPISRITGQMNAFNAGLEKISDAVSKPTLSDATMVSLQKIIDGLRAVPVNVEIKVIPVEPLANDPDMLVGIQSDVVQGDPAPAPSKKRKPTQS